MNQEELHPSISRRPGTRPTIEQHWANIEAWAKDTESASDHVLLDLRNRVQFLESRLAKDIAHQLHGELRHARPSPGLKQQALSALRAIASGANDTREQYQDLELIGRALHQLPDD